MLHALVDLLPFGKDHAIKSLHDRLRLIKLVIFICEQTQLAIKSFIYHEYHNFDAQVSENLCQVRAYQLLLMTDRKQAISTNLMKLSIEIKKILSTCAELIAGYELVRNHKHHPISKELKQTPSLAQFLEQQLLTFAMNEDEYFLIQTFILSRFKLVDDHEISYGIDYDYLCDAMAVDSKSFARKIIHKLQRNVSSLSCRFIFKLLFELEAEQDRIFLLKSLNYNDEVGRSIIACFEVTKVILDHAIKFKRQICMAVTRLFSDSKDYLLFTLEYCELNKNFRTRSSYSSESNSSIILFKGITRYQNKFFESQENYSKRFMDIGFYNIILCNMAQHPQYTGVLLDDKKYNPYMVLDLDKAPAVYADFIKNQEKEFLRYKYRATEIGCIPENLSLFLLTHIRCANSEANEMFLTLEPAL